jgi:hypothetical protein
MEPATQFCGTITVMAQPPSFVALCKVRGSVQLSSEALFLWRLSAVTAIDGS